MIFNSYEFILIFLPIAFLFYAAVHRFAGWKAATGALGIISLVFYAQWSLMLLMILIVSVVSNFVVGNILNRQTKEGRPSGKLLLIAIVGNLVALGYFKYTNFFIDIANQLSGAGLGHANIILPVGISFYTFIQIGFLVEAHSGQAEEQPFLRYLTFATFFPCVTAGPLVLQREVFDQLKDPNRQLFNARRIAVGLAMFSLGLFKKVVLADSIAPYANTAFDGVAAGQSIGFIASWAGSLAYTLQLYFDFSGYSDLALGLGAIFGVLLPLNFNSPFKATSISDFWQRWHMTMTRFFTTYVFSPLAMRGMRQAVANEYSPMRRFMASGGGPIILTMLVAGIWHGSGWVFVLYGLLHGVAIAINNAWRHFAMPKVPPVLGWMMTMAVVVSGLTIFRSPDLATAGTMLAQMWGLGPALAMAGGDGVVLNLREAFLFIGALGFIVLALPNTQEILSDEWISTSPQPREKQSWSEWIQWKPNLGWSAAAAAMFLLAFTSIGSDSSFLYYKF